MKLFLLILFLVLSAIACLQKEPSQTDQKQEDIGVMPLGITGTLIQHDSIPTKFVDPRPVTVWLPDSYEEQSNKTYPVLYFMDGQNLFNPKTSYIGVDWAIDEWADSLMKSGKMSEAIIVGIWNSPKRISEYFPQKASAYFNQLDLANVLQRFSDYEPLADNFLRYLVEDVKSFVDKTYRTESGRDATGIAGSSMGGLISLYAVSEYPEVFGTALCVSTHWPIGNGVTQKYFRDRLPKAGKHRIYFDFGTETLDKEYEPYQIEMDKIMIDKGYTSGKDWVTLKFEGEDHSERAWRKRADRYLLFALGKLD